MTEKQLKQAKSRLSQGERFDRIYSAYEGGICRISKKESGTENRWSEIPPANHHHKKSEGYYAFAFVLCMPI